MFADAKQLQAQIETDRALYNQETLKNALEANRKDNRKTRKVGQAFGFPESILRKQLQLNVNNPNVPSSGRKAVFSSDIEEESVDYIIKLCKLFYLRRLIFKCAQEHKFQILSTVRTA